MPEPEVRALLRTIAARSLDSRRGPPAAVDPSDEEALLAGIGRERLGGLAVAAAQGGELSLSPAGAEELLERHEDQLALDLRLERVLVEAVSILEREGIVYRAVKGPLLAHVAYDDPALRSFGDVDVLVRGPDFDGAVRALRGLGFARRFAEPRPGFDARFSKGSCLERGDGMEIDLHRTLAPGAFGVRLERIDLFGRSPHVFELGTRSITGLDREMMFVHACFHAALGDHPPRLVPLRDIAQLFSAGIDETAVIALADTARCVAVFQRALELLDDHLGVELPGALSARVRAWPSSRFDRWALQSYASDDRSYAGQVASSLLAMRSTRDRIAYGAALMFPSRDYVASRERGYGRRFARGLRVVRDSRPR